MAAKIFRQNFSRISITRHLKAGLTNKFCMICHDRYFFSAITPLRFIAILAEAQFFNKQPHFHKNVLTSSSLLLKFPRVTFKLNPRHTYNDTFNLFYRCNGRTLAISTQHASQIKNQASLFPPILQQPDVVDFSTSIQFHSGFKLIVMGDSVAVQFGEGLDESLEMAALSRKNDSNISSNRTTLKYKWGLHEAITYHDLGQGNALAICRLLGFLGYSGQEHWRPNQPWKNGYGGWNMEDVDLLMDETRNVNVETNRTMEGNFQAMIFRISHGWIPLELITEAKLKETVTLAHDLFGVETIIVTTVPFTNNIQTEKDFLQVKQVNDMINMFCLTHRASPKNGRSGVKNVMLLDLHQLVNAFMEANAIALGYNTSLQQSKPVWYWMERLTQYPKSTLHASIAHVCAAPKPATDAPRCHKQNSFSIDGMHYCMSTIGGRLSAAVACLLKCVYDDRERTLDGCATSCNQQFMSLNPIPKSMYNRFI